MKTGLNDITGSIGRLGASLKKLGGIIAAVFAVKQLVAFSRECIELGSDLAEVQNVVDVTFGKMSGVIEKFSKEAAVQFGLSELAAKQYTSTIGAMYKSMGFTEEAAAGMSIEMTKLAADMASFYNLDADTAFNKIRSGISGETEPLKQLGINLSEANLEEFRLAQGIETAYKNMDQQNKALLRYNYLLSVTKDAQGDFTRTSGSWANQMKVLHLQFQSIKADLGQGFINLFLPILQVINKLLQGLAKLASAFKAFTELITGKKSETKSSGVASIAQDYSDAADSAADYADATDDVATATKNAKKQNDRYLSGLDEIHKFQEESAAEAGTASKNTAKTPSKSAGTSVASIAPVDFGSLETGETVVDGLATKMKNLYDTITKGVQPTITALQKLWNEGLSVLGKFTWDALKGFYDNFLVPIGKWTFGEGLPRFINALNDGILKVNWDRIVTVLNDFWKALEPFAENVGEGLLWLWENVLVPLGTWTMNEVVPRFFQTLTAVLGILNPILEALKPLWQWFWQNILLPVAQWTGGIFLKVWDGINKALQMFGQWCAEHPGTIRTITTLIVSFFAAWKVVSLVTGLVGLITKIGGVISAAGGLMGIITGVLNPWVLAIGAVIAVGVLLWQNWDTVKAKAIEIWTAIKEFLQPLWETISGTAVRIFNSIKENVILAWEGIKTKASEIWEKIKTAVFTVWKAITDRCRIVFNAVANKISTVWNSIKRTATSLWEKIKTGVVLVWDGLKEKCREIFEGIGIKISGIWSSIKTTASTLWETIKTNVIEAWNTLKNKAVEKFEAVKTTISGAWESVRTTAGELWGKITTALETTWKLIKEKAKDKFDEVKGKISDAWESVRTTAGDIWGKITNALEKTWGGVITTAKDKFDEVKGKINGAWETIRTRAGEKWVSITNALKTTWDNIKDKAEEKFGNVKSTITGVWGDIKDKAEEKWGAIKKTLVGDSGIITKIKDNIISAGGDIRDGFYGAFQELGSWIIQPLNWIIRGINSMIKGVVEGINNVIDTLNKLSFTIPNWVPKFGGSKFGLNISRISSYWQIGEIPIPQLAKGAVIPPRSPFVAMLGDQRSGTNIEAPIETIREAVRDVVGSGDIHITLNLDGRTVFDDVLKQARIQQQFSGFNPFELA